MAMKDLVEEFLDYLSVERGLSANTISAYRRAIEANPQNKKALYSLGMTLALQKQQYEEARDLWNRVRKLGPENAEERAKYKLSYHRQSLLSLATYYRRINDPDGEADAREELNRYYPPRTGAAEGADTSP